MIKDNKMGYLVLESGEIFSGRWHGGTACAGEVVFNTSHSGYEQIASDPSYYNQIVIMTAPMQGNYGFIRKNLEAQNFSIRGFICVELQKSTRDSEWMQNLDKAGIPIVSEVDTRKLVLHLREHGTLWGALVEATSEASAREHAQGLISKAQTGERDWPYLVSTKKIEVREGRLAKGPRVAVVDFGCKKSILDHLLSRSSSLAIFPSRVSAEEILRWNPNGVLLSNGPGDPADVLAAPETVKALLGRTYVFGICMGVQILARALGGSTYKLKFGHRGSNHPVKDQILNRIYVTSQNHGYAVDPKSLPSDALITHTNLNDGTVEGFVCERRKCMGVQFHPESHPGPDDAEPLFDYFMKQIL